MNHLPRSRHGIEHLSVPFVAGFEYDGHDFSSFPSRCGFDVGRLQEASVESLASLIQSWLYFGVLDDFFERHIDVHTFRAQDSDLHVSSLPLLDLLDQWIETVVLPVLDAPPGEDLSEIDPAKLFEDRTSKIRFLETVLDHLETVEGLPQSSQHPLPLIILSAQVLVGTLSGVLNEVITLGEDLMTLGYFDRKRRIESNVPLPSGFNQISPACQLLLDEFAAYDCCPCIARQICASYNYVTSYYISRLRITSNASHKRCTITECTANNVDMSNYTTRHAADTCACSHLPIPVDEVREIIAMGGIPLIRVERDAQGEISVRVKKMSGSTPYIAFSHVWSDGLGNPAANSLPKCQMIWLQECILETSQPRLSLFELGIVNFNTFKWDIMRMSTKFKPQWFWLDTLCIPVGEQYVDLKMKAINQMAAIYASASQVMVLDSGVERFPLEQAEIQSCEILARICTTAWMRRCWTFQEAAIGPQCHIRFLESSIDPLEINVGQLSRFQWAMQAESLVTILRRCYSLIRYYWPRLQYRDLMVYGRTIPDRSSKAAVTSLVSRPFKDLLMDQFQGRKSATGTYDEYQDETVYQEFIRCWNTLTRRTTTMWDDIHLILANLLGFNAFEILRLKEPAERMKCLLWSVPALPLSMFFNSEGPRHDPGGHHTNRWLPLYPKHNHVKAEPRVYLENSCIVLTGTAKSCKDESSMSQSSPSSKSASPSTESASPSSKPMSELHRICALKVSDRMIGQSLSQLVVPKGSGNLQQVTLSVKLLRQPNDTFAEGFGAGSSVLVLEKDLTNNNGNFASRGALFQIITEEDFSGSTKAPNLMPDKDVRLDVVFDCPVTVVSNESDNAQDVRGQQQQSIDSSVLDHPWKLNIRCDPPVAQVPLPRRSPRPHPAVVFGLFYIVYFFLWLIELASTFILVAVCCDQFYTFSRFTKALVVVRFIFDILTLLGFAKVMFLHDALFLLWELLPLTLVMLYLASRLISSEPISTLEKIFVSLSTTGTVLQIMWKWPYKWLFTPLLVDFWQRTFAPDWKSGGVKTKILKLFRPVQSDGSTEAMFSLENDGI